MYGIAGEKTSLSTYLEDNGMSYTRGRPYHPQTQGNLSVDFEQEGITLSLFPRSKTARLFSLESPIRVSGCFSKIKLNVNVLGLGLTYISFITSPLHVPTRWVFEGKPPIDGSAVCEQFFDRQYVKI